MVAFAMLPAVALVGRLSLFVTGRESGRAACGCADRSGMQTYFLVCLLQKRAAKTITGYTAG